TLTYTHRQGNLCWWCPWECFRFVRNGTVNCVGLTNPGIKWWCDNYPSFNPDYKFIVSIRPHNVREAVQMAEQLNRFPLVGVELNASCPSDGNWSADKICAMSLATAIASKHPVIIKLGYTDPYVQVCSQLDGMVAAF